MAGGPTNGWQLPCSPNCCFHMAAGGLAGLRGSSAPRCVHQAAGESLGWFGGHPSPPGTSAPSAPHSSFEGFCCARSEGADPVPVPIWSPGFGAVKTACRPCCAPTPHPTSAAGSLLTSTGDGVRNAAVGSSANQLRMIQRSQGFY